MGIDSHFANDRIDKTISKLINQRQAASPRAATLRIVPNQAALWAALAGDERGGNDRMAGSCWSKAAGFAVLATLRRQP